MSSPSHDDSSHGFDKNSSEGSGSDVGPDLSPHAIILESITDAFVAVDSDWRLTYVNERAEHMLRRSRDELLGEGLWEQFPEAVELEFYDTYHRVMETGEPAELEAYFPPLETWFEVKVHPMDTGGLSIYFDDVTTRKKQEEALQDSHMLLEESQRIARLGHWDWDVTTGAIEWSDETFRILGYEPGAIEPSVDTYFDAVPEPERTRLQTLTREALDTGHIEPANRRTEHRIVRPDGTERVVELEARVADTSAEGQPTRLLGTVLDVTRRRKREEQLRLMSRAVEDVAESVIITGPGIDAPGPRIEYVNPAFEAMTGYAAEEVIGKTPRILQGPDTDRETLDRIRTRLEAGESLTGATATNYRKDGTPFEIEWNITPVRGEDGAIEHWVSVQRDVTARRRREKALRESRMKLEESQRIARLGHWDWDVTTGAIEWSDETFRIFGYEPGAIAPSVDTYFNAIPEPDRKRIAALNQRALTEGHMQTDTHRIVRPDGAERVVELQGHIMDTSAEGRPTRILGTVLDITERKRREQTLAEREALLRSINDHIAEGIYRSTPDEQLVYVNEAFATLFGYDDRDPLLALGDLATLYVRPERQGELVRKVREQGRFQGEEVEFRRADGSTFWGLLSARTVYDEDGSVQYRDGAVMDITERKRAERELIKAKERAEEMSRLKSALLANMSHEIRTPLTSIIGFADVLAEHVEGEAEELLKMIRLSGERLERTLTSVLELAQLESQAVTVQSDEIDLAREVREALSLFRGEAGAKGLRLEADVPEGPVPAALDQGAVQRILTNLISNAVKFTDEGFVRVRLHHGAAQVVIQVEDSGIGIEPDQMERIFEEFVQESEGYTRKYEGVGLGLHIAQRLVRLLGGQIGIQSAKGEGSQFTVTLPYAVRDSSSVDASPTGRAPPSDDLPEGAVQLLFVDDNALSRELFPLLLKKIDPRYVVNVVGTAKEALDRAAAARYDGFIVDINLGGSMDGVDLMRELRRDPAYADTPMMACTAYALPGDDERFLAAGFNAYLSKPYRVGDLLAALRHMFAS
jgi:PAS domain S-box-containing protein